MSNKKSPNQVLWLVFSLGMTIFGFTISVCTLAKRRADVLRSSAINADLAHYGKLSNICKWPWQGEEVLAFLKSAKKGCVKVVGQEAELAGKTLNIKRTELTPKRNKEIDAWIRMVAFLRERGVIAE